MSRLRLTPLGALAVKYGVLTPATFWQSLAREIGALSEEDADWDVLVDERIRGMEEMRRMFHEHGEPANWPAAVAPSQDGERR